MMLTTGMVEPGAGTIRQYSRMDSGDCEGTAVRFVGREEL